VSDESDFEVPEFLKETYRQQERERIIKLLKLEFGIGVDLERTEMRDAIILSLIEQIRGEQK
jgi:hypothetical protein